MGDVDLVLDADRCRWPGGAGLAPNHRSRSGLAAGGRLQLPAFPFGLGLLCAASDRTSGLSVADQLALHARLAGSGLRLLLHTFHDPRQPSQYDCDIPSGLGLHVGISRMVRRCFEATASNDRFEIESRRTLEGGTSTAC